MDRQLLVEGQEYYEHVARNVLEIYPELSELDEGVGRVGALDQDVAGYKERCEQFGCEWGPAVILGIALATHTYGMEMNDAHNLMHTYYDEADQQQAAAEVAHSCLVAGVYSAAVYMQEWLRLLVEAEDGQQAESQGASEASTPEPGV